MISAVARTFKSVPERSAPDTWHAIVALLAPTAGEARTELLSIDGIACSLITDRAFTAPGIVTGSGPRVRIYCLYDDEAIGGDSATEYPLAFNATDGDWAMSLPCDKSDLGWVRTALAEKSKRVTARDKDQGITLGEESSDNSKSTVLFDEEAFLRS